MWSEYLELIGPVYLKISFDSGETFRGSIISDISLQNKAFQFQEPIRVIKSCLESEGILLHKDPLITIELMHWREHVGHALQNDHYST